MFALRTAAARTSTRALPRAQVARVSVARNSVARAAFALAARSYVVPATPVPNSTLDSAPFAPCTNVGPDSTVNKVWPNAAEAIKDVITGNQLILSAGFGLCGTAETLIQAIVDRPDIKGLTVVSNNAGNVGAGGLSPLVLSGQIEKMILSYVGTNKALQDAYIAGNVALELTPQGTIAERLRAAGAGMPGFYTRTGSGTAVETGDIPIKWSKPDAEGKQVVEVPGHKKEVREFDGKRYIFEPAVHGDVAIFRAWKVDKAGNCVFRYTTRAFGTLVAKAAKYSLVEAENIVEIGEIDPMDIDLPGIYVDRVVPATEEKKIELVTLTEPAEAAAESKDDAPKSKSQENRIRIAKRAAKELKDGYYCNLGVGIPVLAANYVPEGVNVWLQSENGILGMGRYPTKEELDADVINAGKETVTLVPGASVFDSSESFTMIRGGHVDVSILGAMEVSATGDLANFMIPGKLVKGMGGAMDLVSAPEKTKIICVTNHCDKYGNSKIVEKCSLPLTGKGVVSTIITDLAVFQVDRENKSGGGLTLTELAEGVTLEEIKEKTGAPFKVAENLGTF
ncbi:Succinyl-CoA:3-ketoacid-coenzyme A transferase [Trichosporon asahii var. asahii CBS 8904]|uniref:Succinyl-CoA:3-ketoacid-coenzyme A transferase n=2 Tax=Trichosporon asahii var. asahii TaxID=189963 RepID=K1VKE5_TRIAC|nr:Succinyl-CoA:3-ketoacid-coenzyme A transferase [Trichosporon asahii var. asahii CBS 2479]EJT49685.1 Succinyl-CoA:3-ketoacid-coenzyme A transferase [Trichosporon asahii var. asahii CBS 2479]EKC97252.1 Succinyl-CoA:3-ketoacid-coenzyme A transferase [Trichosporon asahii var. asahii CBS 8904]